MLKFVKFVLAIFVLGISEHTAARILAVFPTPSISHQVVFRPLVRELAERGHELVVVTTDPAYPKGQTPKNITEIDVHDMSYVAWDEFLKASTGNPNDLYTQIKTGLVLVGKIFMRQMATEEVKTVLKEGNFDLLMSEALSRPALVLSHIFKVPVIQVSSFGAIMGNFECLGAPVHPILYPMMFRQKIVNLTFWEKVSELRTHYSLNRLSNSVQESENEMLKETFGADVPSVSELCNNVDMLFLNTHPIFDSHRPVPPSIIYMGGLHQNPVKELPKVSRWLKSSPYT